MAMLEIEGLQKNYDTVQVLKGIDLTLEKGEVLSIIGSSGSGKTTFLRCINFLEQADKGKMRLNQQVLFDADSNQKISTKELAQKRLHFGMVFQGFHLFPQYTALENITLAMNLHHKKSNRDNKILQQNKEKALALLEEVGLREKAQNYPFQLSGGQQQRVAIARALALEPDILCFDEPTSALDPELTQEVLRVIQKLKEKHMSMIVVTHEMEFAYRISDRVIFMAEGKIEEQGTPEEVFHQSKSEVVQSFLKNVRV